MSKFVPIIAVALTFMAAAQDPAPPCKGKLSDFLGKTCEAGGLAFTFGKEFDGGGVQAKDVTVNPTAKNPGLQFTFPKMNELDMARFDATVAASKGVFTHARLTLEYKGDGNVSSSEGVFTEKDKVSLGGDLTANSFAKVMQGKIANPGNSLKAIWTVAVNISQNGVTPVVTSTFVVGK
jgi:hypothetical protein